ncbi:response regulator [Sessilibacter sp. MAH2]
MTELRVLTTGEAAKYCGVNFRTIIRWIERGRLKAYKLPGRGDHRIKQEDFVEFLRENELPVPEELETGALEACTTPKVLVVDDNPEMAKAIERVFRMQGYEVTTALDGFVAGSLVSTIKPDLITLDLRMPGIDGFEVLKYLRTNEQFKKMKVLVISAESTENLIKTLDLGADDFLQKPFENITLIEKAHQLIAV